MAQRKETKKQLKIRDLKPKKDAKGGVVLDVNTKNHQQSHNIQNNNVNNRNVNHVGL